MKKHVLYFIIAGLVLSCSRPRSEVKRGLYPSSQKKADIAGFKADSLDFETRPRNVLLTGNPAYRLTPVYKVNYDKKGKYYWAGSNHYHYNYYSLNETPVNNWNDNFMPGFEAVHGYNMVNISHYNNQTKSEHKLFSKPILVQTLYYPAYTNDTLNGQPILRKYYMVSGYDEDTNKDGHVNTTDLRRFYFFDIEGKSKRLLTPLNYSVMSSEYDFANDYMYVFAKQDQNKNGMMDDGEQIHIFWIDLSNPENIGREY